MRQPKIFLSDFLLTILIGLGGFALIVYLSSFVFITAIILIRFLPGKDDLIIALFSIIVLPISIVSLATFWLTATSLVIYKGLGDETEINQTYDLKSLGVVLANKLDKYFDKPELVALCFELDIDYENLRGDTKIRKCQELIGYCQRRGRIQELIERARLNRPHVSWP